MTTPPTASPHDAHAERVVLCGLLVEPVAVASEVVRAGFLADDFYDWLHGRVFALLLAAVGSALTADDVGPSGLSRGVMRTIGYDAFGGGGFFGFVEWAADVMELDPTGYDALPAAIRVRELAVRRALIHRARELAADAAAGVHSPEVYAGLLAAVG